MQYTSAIVAFLAMLSVPLSASPIRPPVATSITDMAGISNLTIIDDHAISTEVSNIQLDTTSDHGFIPPNTDDFFKPNWTNDNHCSRPCYRSNYTGRGNWAGKIAWMEVATRGFSSYDSKFLKDFHIALGLQCSKSLQYFTYRQDMNDLYADFSPDLHDDSCIIATLDRFGGDDCWRCYDVYNNQVQGGDSWNRTVVTHDNVEVDRRSLSSAILAVFITIGAVLVVGTVLILTLKHLDETREAKLSNPGSRRRDGGSISKNVEGMPNMNTSEHELPPYRLIEDDASTIASKTTFSSAFSQV